MRHFAVLVGTVLLVILGCRAEEQTSTPAVSETAAPAPAPVAEEVVVEEVVEEGRPAPPSEVDVDPRLSEPTGELRDALNSGDEDRIIDAIAILEEQGGQSAIVAISTVFDHSDDADMKIEAIDSLAFLADEGDVSPALEKSLRDPSPDVRIEAADVIVELELVELLPVLRTRGYQESDPDVREVIEDAIFELEPVNEESDERG